MSTRPTPAGHFARIMLAGAAALGGTSCSNDPGTIDGRSGGTAGATTGGASAGGAAGSASGGQATGGNATAGRGTAGVSGTSGASGSGAGGSSAGTPAAGGSAGMARAGSSGASSAGRAGSSAAGGGGIGGDAGGANDGGMVGTSSGCAGRNLLLCEDFETTAVGSVPSGWTRHGDLAAVDDGDAHGGARALRLGPAASSERRIYHDAALLGSAHWGRIYYKVETPVPDAFVHSTMVSLIGNGPRNGQSDYRPLDTIKQAIDTPDVGGHHNFIYNVQIIGSSEFGTETNYTFDFDAKWHCAEYHIDASNQSYALYLDGDEILSFENGAGNYGKSDIPDSFDELRVGWINYQSAPPGFTAWLDDIAFDDARISCD